MAWLKMMIIEEEGIREGEKKAVKREDFDP